MVLQAGKYFCKYLLSGIAVIIDLGLGYHINDTFTMSGQVTNLFDAEFREFTASPFIGRLYSVELKVNLGKK